MARRLPPRPKKNAAPKGRTGAKPPARRPTGPGRPRRDDAGPRPVGPRLHRPESAPEPGSGEPERLHRFLARAGLGSRRGCEELIVQGRVTVNGEVIRELGTKVQPASDVIAVDGQRVHHERTVYFAVNKPRGYVSTNDDPAGRPRVIDLVAEVPERVYSVGRLDEDSTGLMLLTNDGELANQLAHPRFGVEKVYRALVAGLPERETLDKLIEGVWLSDGKARAKRVRITGRRGEATMIELVLAEGKNREVRRMLAKLGHKVMTLQRVAVGPVSLKGLKVGDYRHLTGREVDQLRRVAKGESVPTAEYGDRDEIRMSRESAPRRGAARHERRPTSRPVRPPVRPETEGGSVPPSRGGTARPGREPQGVPPARPAGPAGKRPRRPDQEGPALAGPRGPRRRDEAGHFTGGRPGGRGPKRPAAGPHPSVARRRDREIEVRPELEGAAPPPRRGPAGARPRPAGPRSAGPRPRPAGPGLGGPRPRPAGPGTGGPRPGPARSVGGSGPQGRRPSPSGGPPSRRIIGLEPGGPGEGQGGPPRPRPKARPKPMRKPRRERPADE
jgi:23S rRNA pseudouridine2605 synthase